METNNSVNAPQQSKKVYAILAILLGTLGIHNFFAGHKKRAIIELVLGVVLWVVTMVVMANIVQVRGDMAYVLESDMGTYKAMQALRFVPLIWAFIDIFKVKADGNGVPFK